MLVNYAVRFAAVSITSGSLLVAVITVAELDWGWRAQPIPPISTTAHATNRREHSKNEQANNP